jgi:hypothetical protein
MSDKAISKSRKNDELQRLKDSGLSGNEIDTAMKLQMLL